MVKTSTKAAIAVAMYAVPTLTGFAEDVKKSFEYLGKTYLLSQGATITQDREPEQGGPIHKQYDIITREDNPELIFRQDDNGEWFYDPNHSGTKDNNEDYMSNDFKIRADRAKNLEKLMTFEAASERPGYEGKVFEYDFWSDGTVSRKDEPSVTFYPKWKYDDNVKITSMSDTFNREANSRIINDVIGSSIDKYNASQEEVLRLQKKNQELTNMVKHYTGDRANTAVIVNALRGDGFGYVGAGIARTLSDKIAIAGTLIAGVADDKTLRSKTTEPSSMGVYAEMATEQVDLKKLGASLELMVNFEKGWNMSFGGGVLSNKWDEVTEATFFQDNNDEQKVLNELEPFSETGSQISPFFRFGFGKESHNLGIGLRGIVDFHPVDKTLAFGGEISYRPQVKKKETK